MALARKILFLILVIFVSITFSQRTSGSTILTSIPESRSYDANNIVLSKVTGHGDFNSATWSLLNYGTLPAKRILFDAGFWMTGRYNGEVHSSIKFYSDNYSPGPIINGQPAMIAQPEDSLRYRVYKIFKGNDPQNPDLLEWPEDYGAPVDDNGNPLILGDQLLWSAYNLLDTNYVDSNFANPKKTGILPIEVHQKIYGREGNKRDSEDLMHNVVFWEWTIINKGNSSIDSTFIGLWCDIDFYDIRSNLPAVDRTRQTGYLWSEKDFEPSLGGVPPAVGLTVLYGPKKPHPDSTAVFKGEQVQGFYNLPIYSFKAIGDDKKEDPLYGPPRKVNQVYNASNGLSNSGGIIFDPITSRATKFPFSGDPVQETGWLFPPTESGNGSGFVLFLGPFDIAPNDTQWVMAALVPGLGGDKKGSIIMMREKIDILRNQPYDSLAFGSSPLVTSVTELEEELPKSIMLYQNYPNPFNPSTKIKFAIPPGLSVNHNELKVTLTVYDMLGRELVTLINEPLGAGVYEIEFDGTDLPSGVYFYRFIMGNYIQSNKMLLLK